MGRSSSRSSSREEKKKRKTEKDDKKKKKQRSRSNKKDSKRKRSASRDKKKKRSSESIDHKKKKSRSRDRKKRSYSKDKKKRYDRSNSRKRQKSKDKGSSSDRDQKEKPVELTEEQKLLQKQRERLAKIKMLKYQSNDDSDDDDDDDDDDNQQPIQSNKNFQTQSNIEQNKQVEQELQKNVQQEMNTNSEITQPIQDQQNDSPRMQQEEDPIMIQIQQQIEAQAKKQSYQSSQKQNLASPNQLSQENDVNRERAENQNEMEEEIILEKNTSRFNQYKKNYVEDYLNENSESEDNMYGEEFDQNNAKQEVDNQNQDQNDFDDLKFDNSDEEVDNLRQNGNLNGNSKFYSEKLQKLQMMNQQQNDADEFEGFLSLNKQQNQNQANSQKSSNGNLNTSQNTVIANTNSNGTIKIQTLDTSQSSMNKSNFTNNKTINQQQLVDEEQEQESDESDLDLFMKSLEEEENATKGIKTADKNSSNQNNTKQKQTYITMEDILGKKKFKEDIEEEQSNDDDDDIGNQDKNNKVYSNGESIFNQQFQEGEDGNQDDEEEDNKFHQAFKEQMLKLKQEKRKDNKGALIMDEEQEKEEEREAFFDPENGESKEDYMERLKKEAQKKELKPIDYNEDELEYFQKNFYIESKEISQMTEEEVKIYRENLGEIQVKGQDVPRPIKSWLQSGLSDRILEVLVEKKKYDKPFPIQCQSLPVIMSGRDMLGIAETGSGKTLAYLLPMIRHVSAQRPLQEGDGPIGLILVPTRELATQIYLEAKPFLKSYKYEIVAVFGGTGIKGQLSELKRGCEIVVATPGRLIDVLTTSNGKITNLKRVTMVVIDEADRMFDQGFEPQIAKILATTRPDKQTVLFSATFPKNVENLAKKLLRHKPTEIVVGARGQACTNITQLIEIRDESTRLFRLLELLGIYSEQGQVIIFVDKQIEVDFLYQELRSRYYLPTILHAGVDADDRVSNSFDFRKGIFKILIATSLSSRGLDVKNVVLVVNYKCPNHIEDYIHRIGRTGRAGNKGTAVTFIGPDEDKYSLDLIKALKRSDQKVPDELQKMGDEFKKKVKMGEAKIYNNVNIKGNGFNFDEEERDKMNQMKYEQKKFLALQMGFDIEERDDDFVFSKAQEESAKDKKEKDELTFQQKLHIVKTQDEYKDIREELFSKASEIANQKKLLGCGDEEIKKAIEEVFKKGLENFIPSTKNIDQGKIKIAKMLQEFQKSNDIANNICFEEIEINDYPENARKAVTKRDFQDRIYLQTGCLVVQKGIYVEIGKKVQPGFQKLYLRIEGDSEYQVRMAYRDIKAELEEKSIKIHERGGAQQGRFTIQ